jgi:hypothetical protein
MQLERGEEVRWWMNGLPNPIVQSHFRSALRVFGLEGSGSTATASWYGFGLKSGGDSGMRCRNLDRTVGSIFEFFV